MIEEEKMRREKTWSQSRSSFRLLSQTTLRNILGTKNLHEILSDRESISSAMQVSIFLIFILKISSAMQVIFEMIYEEMKTRNTQFLLQKMLDEATEPWGIKVERVEMWAKLFLHKIIFLIFSLSLSVLNPHHNCYKCFHHHAWASWSNWWSSWSSP